MEQGEATVLLRDKDPGGKQGEARQGTGVRRIGVGGKGGIPRRGSSGVQRPAGLRRVFRELQANPLWLNSSVRVENGVMKNV